MFEVKVDSSRLMAIWLPSLEAPDVTSFLNALESDSYLSFASVQNRPPRSAQCRWEILADVETEDADPLRIRLALVPMPELWPGHLQNLGLTAEQPARWAILSETTFRKDRVLDDFLLQLQVLAIVTPEGTAVWDYSALAPRAPGWLHAMAEVEVPPSPRYLFSIQSVADQGVAWLHTHGLHRCRCIELEALDVPIDHASSVATLINSVAGTFLEDGVPDPGTSFFHGGLLELQWLPYKEAASKLPKPIVGGAEDRQDHDFQRGVLLVPKSARLFGLLRGGVENVAQSPVALDMPFELVTPLESARRSLLARERWDKFASLFSQHRGQPNWAFVVKLGYPCDIPESPIEREHLWFEVHKLVGKEIEATLDSSPNYVSHLQAGQRGRYPLDLLSEWAIFCEQGKIDADNVWMYVAE